MKIVLVVISAVLAIAASSQENLIYAELGGAGPLVSANYERELTKTPLLYLRAGLGYVSTWDYEGITLPSGIYFLQSLKNNNYLELGMNYTFLFDKDEDDYQGFFLPAIGYRNYFNRNSGFLKLTFNPVFFDDDPLQIIPWGGISYGFRF